MDPVVQVKDLETTFFLKSGPFRAVNRISYSINQGETLGIVGESGCGKSVTSLNAQVKSQMAKPCYTAKIFLNLTNPKWKLFVAAKWP